MSLTRLIAIRGCVVHATRRMGSGRKRERRRRERERVSRPACEPTSERLNEFIRKATREPSRRGDCITVDASFRENELSRASSRISLPCKPISPPICGFSFSSCSSSLAGFLSASSRVRRRGVDLRKRGRPTAHDSPSRVDNEKKRKTKEKPVDARQGKKKKKKKRSGGKEDGGRRRGRGEQDIE